MKRTAIIASIWLSLACNGIGLAADPPETRSEVPVPPVVGEKGIWGAIAYSQADAKYGFFWGADKRPEAEETALKHCERAGGKNCTVATVFRNHRHWDDDDGTGFPYNHCAALAVSEDKNARTSAWGSKSATTRKEAEDLSLSTCEAKGAQCKIREWVCT